MALIGKLNFLATLDNTKLIRALRVTKTSLEKFRRGFKASFNDTAFSKWRQDLTDIGKKYGNLGKLGFTVGTITRKFASLAKMVAGTVVHSFNYMAKRVAIASTLIFASIVKVGAGFEKQMSRVKAFSGSTAKEMKMLTGVANDLGHKTIFSASQVAQGQAVLSQAGFKAEKIAATMPSLLTMAAAGEIEVVEAARYVSLIMSQMNMPGDQFSKVVDTMAVAASSSVTDMAELAEALSYTGTVAYQLGVPIEQVVAMLQVLANAGIRGERAGTSVRNMLNRLAGGASERAKDKMEEMGIEVEDASGNMRNMADIIQQFINKTAKLSRVGAVEEMMAIFELRAGPSMLAVMGAGSEELLNITDRLTNSQGTAKEMADTLWDNLYGDTLKLISAINFVRIGIFNTFGDSLRAKVKAITDWINNSQKELISWGAKFSEVFLDAMDIAYVLFKYINENGTRAFVNLGDVITSSLIGGMISGISTMITLFIDGIGVMIEMLPSLIVAAVSSVGEGIHRMIFGEGDTWADGTPYTGITGPAKENALTRINEILQNSAQRTSKSIQENNPLRGFVTGAKDAADRISQNDVEFRKLTESLGVAKRASKRPFQYDPYSAAKESAQRADWERGDRMVVTEAFAKQLLESVVTIKNNTSPNRSKI